MAFLTAVRSGMGRRSATVLLLGFGLAVALSACTRTKVSEAPRGGQGQVLPGPGTRGGTVPPGETPKVALLLPMSGDYEKLGTAMRQAAEMALFDVAGKRFVLTPIDTQGTAEGARRAAQQAKAAGVHLVLGPLFAHSVKAVKEEFEGSGVNIIAFSTDPTVAGDNVFLMGFLVKPQITRILSYASQQNLKRVAVVAPQGPYGDSVIASVNEAAQRSGVNVVGTLLYPTDTEEMNKSLRGFTNYDVRARDLLKVLDRTRGKTDLESRRERAKARRESKVPPPEWDAVLVAEGGARLLLVASMLAYYDVDPDKVQYLGTGQWDDTAIAKEPNLKGAWFPAPPPPARAKFEAKFKEQFKADPPRIATLAYDAVALAAVLARTEGGADFSREAIASPNGFAGIDGIFRFLPSGMSERGLAVLEVAEGEFRMIGNAPNTFEAPTE